MGDLVRRTLIANMNVAMERPETRDFTFNPLHQVLEDRGKYIAAVLTIARAYLVCKNKIKLTNFSGLEGWS
jgi:putative DNA primase/helicase